ncbi:choline/glycine/proline betaine transport protein [Desulfatibacillum alkenivorans DSM 16219]|uniref:Choline/glycine/proline betaine transport protein n=1 Tax=Desulfatibacillum alkenivorans DSM 16219 TaxID=1121393 RepID=A0A1M6MP46_9BACT|nr:BCCT family transporter [Desulfatibacillum alkenivorans]SHJ85150.1 choline/glycine/proline betaine transport protein [Desulfatibacillum alkenivorans DSM 16219]
MDTHTESMEDPIELSYEQKAIEMARSHWEREKKKAIHQRRTFLGLQIIPTSSYYDESSGHRPGENNWTGFGFDLHPQVSMGAGVLLLIFIVLTLVFGEQSAVFFQRLLDGIGNSFGWLYILSANFFVIVMALIAASRFGNIRIGGPDALPEFSTFSWYAMLISAGMGIGLMFWSVAEPIFHYMDPSPMFKAAPKTAQAAQVALGQTYFHWGIHPWGIYALVGLSLAFFAYNRGLPLTIRSIFYPILGEKIYGFWGNLIDVLSVLATLFGLATSLGLGVKQVASGLHYLFGFPTTTGFAVTLIAVITFFAVLSIITGLDKGVKFLSSANMVTAAVFMVFLLLVGPTVYILKAFTQNIGFYIQNLPRLSFWVEAYLGAEGSNWQNPWTIFYWGWWISWSPFVGMFIARVSKGRTIREFIVGVMLFPTVLSFLWMSTFGGSALWLQLTEVADIASAVNKDVSTALFVMLESFPFTQVTSFIGILLVVIFFVTSSDSGSLVVDHLTSGGKLDSPVPQRIFWGVMEGVCAAVLLMGGGLVALQSASIATGLPFTIVLLVMCYSLYRGLKEEHYHATIIGKMKPETHKIEIPI